MQDNSELTNLCDLHMHLGSAATAHTLWEIAHERGIALKEKDYGKFVDAIEIVQQDSYEKYLKRFDYTEQIQSSPTAVEKCVYEAFSLSYRKSNVDLLELRFNPVNRNHGGFYDLDKLIFAAIIGMKKATMIYPIHGGLIVCMDRRFSPELNLIVAKKAARFAGEGLVGIDLCGPMNSEFKWDDLVEPIRVARDAGLGITVHTGEVTPPSEIWEVLEKINPERIGHGIKAVLDKSLLQELAKRQTVLEVCPTSNFRTKECVNSWDEMKTILTSFKDAGVNFTINSDNPVFLQTNVLKEYGQLMKEGILDNSDVVAANQRARKASFIHKFGGVHVEVAA